MLSKRFLRAGIGGLVLCLAVSLCGFYGRCEDLRGDVVRLHILANSDSDEDQALKLAVRDAVVEAAAGWLDGAENANEALALAEARLPELQAVAQRTVADAGYDYAVDASLCRMYFTTRQYDTATLPAGTYDAVRFTIGSGEGKNWWCVVYPPLCAGAAMESDAALDMLDSAQADLVGGGQRYIVRFKIVEWWENLMNFLR